MPVHEVAARGFGAGASEAYEAQRPDYPVAATEWLHRVLRLGPDVTVCDLAAGTGKLTRSLAATHARVLAVEPVAGMRNVLARAVAEAQPVGAVAEALPFRDATLDAMTVAQAFHWFDPESSLGEIARTLRIGGVLALVWNTWDLTHPWVVEIQRIVAGVGEARPWQRGHRSHTWAAETLGEHPAFGSVELVRFPHAQELTADALVARVDTTSHIVVASDHERARVAAAIRAVLEADPDTQGRSAVTFPYVTEVFTSVRT